MARSRGPVSPTRRRGTANRPAPSERSPLFRRLSGGALLAVAALTVVSLLSGDGDVARSWNRLLVDTFGWGAYLSPLLVGAFGLALVWPSVRQDYRFQRREAVGWLLLFVFFVTLFQLLTANPPRSVEPGINGGAVGRFIGVLLVARMGQGGASVLVAVIGLLGVVLAGKFGPRDLWGLLLLGLVLVLWLGRQLLSLARLLFTLARRATVRLLARRRAQPAPHFRINRPELEAAAAPAEPEPPVSPKEPRIVRVPTRSDGVAGTENEPASIISAASGDGAGRRWTLPPITLLEASGEGEPSEGDIRQKVQKIEETLLEFGIKARVVEVNPGPVVTQFGLDPGFRERYGRNGVVTRRDKVKVSEITALRDDLALALAARTVRIEAPVPGRAVIGLEIPNSTAAVVGLRKVLETSAFQRVRGKARLAVALGQDVSGAPVAADLAKMPHLLIAGATGSGKSVCMNAIVTCFLLQTTPEELRMVMIDPKRVELTAFRDVPHLLRSVVVDVEQAVTVLKWVMREMENRLRRFEAQGVRNIEGYNRAMGGASKEAMPYIAVLIDELADLMMTAPEEVERSICRLAQLARATGIHLVIATQRPSVDVVTGLIKANFPTRISFAVASQVDSRTILDTAGAEQLLGSGDMLFLPADASKPRRLQGVFVSDDEVHGIVEFWKAQGPPLYVQDLEEAPSWSSGHEESTDPLYERALDVARQHTRISASLLQRRMGIGYTRAARLVDLLEDRGIVGHAEGGKPREVLSYEGDGASEREE